ncbi:hypothetical protein D3C71_1948960 [compost metagenome]
MDNAGVMDGKAGFIAETTTVSHHRPYLAHRVNDPVFRPIGIAILDRLPDSTGKIAPIIRMHPHHVVGDRQPAQGRRGIETEKGGQRRISV